jgi:hypothetical protein
MGLPIVGNDHQRGIGTTGGSGRHFLKMIRQRIQRAHRGIEVGLVAIDHVTLKSGVTVNEHLVLGNALDRAQRFAERVFLLSRETIAACCGIGKH